MITHIFWLILGLGIALPFTGVFISNLTLKVIVGENYTLDLKRLSIVYLCALIGWSIAIGIR